MIQPNTIIGGRYRVMRPLGGGGMKLVYLAEDLRLAARPCALAEMVDSFTSPDTQKQAVAAFQREADMLAQLNNEHIPRVFDRFSDENHHYLVMEFIDGVTLEQRLKNAGGKLSEVVIIDIALQILDTLEYLHNLEPPVIYRDLKPSNVMITPPGLVKLIDFGIARLFQPLSNATMIGTQGYAPPEQYRGKVEIRSDLYALGATMHHALSGRDPALEPPFSFPPLRSVCATASPALADLVDQALKYDVVLRVADAAEFRERLIAIKTGVAPATSRAMPSHSTASQSQRGTGAPGPSRPQMKLPLGGSQTPPYAAPSAQTVMTPERSPCPRCGREIPLDSNFCSFCAADVTGTLRPPTGWNGESRAGADAEARTIVLDDLADGPTTVRGPDFRTHRKRRRRGGMMWMVVAGAFWLGYAVIKPFLEQRPVDNPDYSWAPAPGVPAPDAAEPAHTEPRLVALRRALDSQGYGAVHFKMDGDTIILWGEVPSEADRMMVQTQIFLVARIFSIEDHLQVHNAFAEP